MSLTLVVLALRLKSLALALTLVVSVMSTAVRLILDPDTRAPLEAEMTLLQVPLRDGRFEL